MIKPNEWVPRTGVVDHLYRVLANSHSCTCPWVWRHAALSTPLAGLIVPPGDVVDALHACFLLQPRITGPLTPWRVWARVAALPADDTTVLL